MIIGTPKDDSFVFNGEAIDGGGGRDQVVLRSADVVVSTGLNAGFTSSPIGIFLSGVDLPSMHGVFSNVENLHLEGRAELTIDAQSAKAICSDKGAWLDRDVLATGVLFADYTQIVVGGDADDTVILAGNGWHLTGEALAVHVFTNKDEKVQILVDRPIHKKIRGGDGSDKYAVGLAELNRWAGFSTEYSGGLGIDQVVLEGDDSRASTTFDLTRLHGVFAQVENLHLKGKVALKIDAHSAREICSDKGAWVKRGGAAAGHEGYTQIVVGGDADDTVILAGGGWVYSGDADAVHVYTHEAMKVQMLVDRPILVERPIPNVIFGSDGPDAKTVDFALFSQWASSSTGYDGGAGRDQVVLKGDDSGAITTFDLPRMPRVLANVENLHLKGQQVVLKIDARSALEICSDKRAWVDRNGAAADPFDLFNFTQIVVGGDADDTVILAGGGWSHSGDADCVHVYTNYDSNVQILVDRPIHKIILGSDGADKQVVDLVELNRWASSSTKYDGGAGVDQVVLQGPVLGDTSIFNLTRMPGGVFSPGIPGVFPASMPRVFSQVENLHLKGKAMLVIDPLSVQEICSTKGAWVERGGAAAGHEDYTQIVVGGDADAAVVLASGDGWVYSGDAHDVHVYTSEAMKVQLLIDIPVAMVWALT